MTAANPLRGEASIAIGETAYHLVLDVNAFCYAQSALAMKPLEMVSSFLADGDDILLTRTLLWAALQRNHPCHELEAGDILGEVGVPSVRAALTDMMVAAFGLREPGTEGKDGENPPKPTRGTGTGSTASTSKRVGKAGISGAKLQG
ncbi:hypothetical protein M527_29220 [Sphingobium indicum IP26]|uniref:hypothetical protein n=1 Tax=Sphingobium sp. HDIP04 TaxID=428994 RepID=UPI00036313F3|nr:hypothetical protein [Sphingobium sp. HDIP04]EPR14196.1 hypothetical protein M527_29220 [Sphingobium indicum IP26]EQB03679.1 hypothetical protein L286_11685 [Sphingobium sp. HDIP04]